MEHAGGGTGRSDGVREDVRDRRVAGRREEDALVAQVRRELRASTTRFELAWAHSPIGMTMVSLDGDWLDVNDALCRLLGRDREELRGRVVERITHPDDLEVSIERLETLVAVGEGSYTLDKRYLHADGTPVEVQLTTTLIPDDGGAPGYVLGQMVDLTEVRRAETQLRRTVADLERSNHTLEAFAEVVSHDLTSPLGTSQALVETVLLHHGHELPGQAGLLLERADRQAQRALATARTLLQLATAGPDHHAPEPVELEPLVQEVVESFASELREVDGRVEVAAGCTVLADPDQLHLVLQNLVANALKFRAPERPLVVRVRCEPRVDEIAIHVDDNGRGVDDVEQLEGLFELGTRGRDGDGVEGLGIGLATCRRIVELHGGRMEVVPRDGPGTRVSVVLPAR
jgi:PAS domain S-box-containing protein